MGPRFETRGVRPFHSTWTSLNQDIASWPRVRAPGCCARGREHIRARLDPFAKMISIHTQLNFNLIHQLQFSFPPVGPFFLHLHSLFQSFDALKPPIYRQHAVHIRRRSLPHRSYQRRCPWILQLPYFEPPERQSPRCQRCVLYRRHQLEAGCVQCEWTNRSLRSRRCQ